MRKAGMAEQIGFISIPEIPVFLIPSSFCAFCAFLRRNGKLPKSLGA